jgi:hypothetical protein
MARKRKSRSKKSPRPQLVANDQWISNIDDDDGTNVVAVPSHLRNPLDHDHLSLPEPSQTSPSFRSTHIVQDSDEEDTIVAVTQRSPTIHEENLHELQKDQGTSSNDENIDPTHHGSQALADNDQVMQDVSEPKASNTAT